MKPFDFQIKGKDYLLSKRYCLCADDMGLGKTLQGALAASETGLPWVVVCPAYLKLSWEADLRKFNIDLSNLLGIVSYASLSKHSKIFEKAKVVVADESHYAKNMKAKRTQRLHHFISANKPEYLFLLSGTPIKNRVQEFYSSLLLLSLNPADSNGIKIDKTFKSEWQFCNYFCNRKDIRIRTKGNKSITIQKWFGIKNKDKLKAVLKNKYYRRTKDQILDLPPIMSTEVIASLRDDPELQEEWDAFNSNKRVSSTAKKKSALLKAKFTAEYVHDLIQQGKHPIVFTAHPDALNDIRDYLESYNVTPGIIDATVKPEDRFKVVEEFQNANLPCVLATIGTGSTGFTLTRSSDMVFNDISWVPADNDQARDRIYRIGQTNKCLVHYIVGSKIDQAIIASNKEKIETIKEVL